MSGNNGKAIFPESQVKSSALLCCDAHLQSVTSRVKSVDTTILECVSHPVSIVKSSEATILQPFTSHAKSLKIKFEKTATLTLNPS